MRSSQCAALTYDDSLPTSSGLYGTTYVPYWIGAHSSFNRIQLKYSRYRKDLRILHFYSLFSWIQKYPVRYRYLHSALTIRPPGYSILLWTHILGLGRYGTVPSDFLFHIGSGASFFVVPGSWWVGSNPFYFRFGLHI